MGKGGKSTRGLRGRSQLDRQDDRQMTRRERSNKGRRRQADSSQLCEDALHKFQRTVFESIEDVKRQEAAITALKEKEVVCPICGKLIEDMASAISDKLSGSPVHFDCAIESIASSEHLDENESIAYIGQGTFAVLRYDNTNDPKSFHIERKIEWESRDSDIPWRHEISTLYSQVL